MNDNWIPLQEVDFSNDSSTQFHIDTRDFHCLIKQDPSDKIPDLTKILKLPEKFFYSPEEIKNLITEYYESSGGKKEWRLLMLNKYEFWLKYIRIFKTEHGLLLCDREYHALNKEITGSGVLKDPYE